MGYITHEICIRSLVNANWHMPERNERFNDDKKTSCNIEQSDGDTQNTTSAEYIDRTSNPNDLYFFFLSHLLIAVWQAVGIDFSYRSIPAKSTTIPRMETTSSPANPRRM
jgi:hypothetical protein